MKVAVLDYGVGNLHSLRRALELFGAQVTVESEVAEALRADALVLPGVGAFGAAAALVTPMAPAVRAALASGMPCLGICLGMQLLFETADEGLGVGLGAVRGHVRRLRGRRVPQMGWNDVHPLHADPLFADLPQFSAYYANTFVTEPANPAEVLATSEYEGSLFPAVVRRDRTWGVQFHPEKSSASGLRLIRNFLEQAQM